VQLHVNVQNGVATFTGETWQVWQFFQMRNAGSVRNVFELIKMIIDTIPGEKIEYQRL
jgi:hypothetical protein